MAKSNIQALRFWSRVGVVSSLFAFIFFLIIGYGEPTDKAQGKTYDERVTIGATGSTSLPAKPEPSKSEAPEPEPSQRQGKTYNESINIVAKAISQADVKVIEKIEKTVVIGIYFLLITVALQIIALKPPCSRKTRIFIAIFVFLTALLLFQADWFLRFISTLFGL